MAHDALTSEHLRSSQWLIARGFKDDHLNRLRQVDEYLNDDIIDWYHLWLLDLHHLRQPEAQASIRLFPTTFFKKFFRAGDPPRITTNFFHYQVLVFPICIPASLNHEDPANHFVEVM